MGKPIDREGDAPITEEQLVYVRVQSNHLPAVSDAGLQLTTPFDAGVGNRNSIHGALNHYVEAHSKGSWHGASSVIIAPFTEMAAQKPPTALNEIDTFFYGEGNIALPHDAVVVINAGDKAWAALLQERPELEQQYTIIRVADPQAIRAACSVAMLRMGYSVIPGGDYSSADRSVSRRVTELTKERQTTEGGLPHFYSVADRLDMMHGAILLDRAKKEHGGEGWVQKVDWTGEQNMVRAQVAELINGIRPFLYNILNTDFEAFHLPDGRRRELMDAVVDLIQDIDTRQPEERPSADFHPDSQSAASEQEMRRRDATRMLYHIASGLMKTYNELEKNQKAALATIAPEAAAFLEQKAQEQKTS